MTDIKFKEKFIAFIDVLGFKEMIELAERGNGRPLAEIREILTELEHAKNKTFFSRHGPQVCPESTHICKDLDFEVTRVSDCAVVSAEVSPAGVINLVHHCWGAALMLLTKGVLVRGYITRGRIYHYGQEFMGTGYHEAYQRESSVTAFKREADEKGTPFIEIDASVCSYVQQSTDACVQKMFDRVIKRDGTLVAIFPFQCLAHSFMVAGWGVEFDPEKEKKNNNVLRESLLQFKDRLTQYIDPANERALSKIRHYQRAIDEQLAVCDKTDEFIDRMSQPALGVVNKPTRNKPQP